MLYSGNRSSSRMENETDKNTEHDMEIRVRLGAYWVRGGFW